MRFAISPTVFPLYHTHSPINSTTNEKIKKRKSLYFAHSHGFSLLPNIFSAICFLLILPPDLLYLNHFISDQFPSIQLHPVHIHRRDLMIFISRVIIDSSGRITAGGIQRYLILSFSHIAAASRLVY